MERKLQKSMASELLSISNRTVCLMEICKDLYLENLILLSVFW